LFDELDYKLSSKTEKGKNLYFALSKRILFLSRVSIRTDSSVALSYTLIYVELSLAKRPI